MNESTILSWITFIPLIGMALVCLAPKGNLTLIKGICLVATGIPLYLATYVYFGLFDKTATGYQLVQQVPWIDALGIQYYVGIDGLSSPLVWLTALLLFIAVPASETVPRVSKA